jgi:Rod binding domain-containing protein
MIPSIGAGPSSALPAIASAALPREVREGSAQDREVYGAALGFERMLLGQLAQSMTSAAGSSSGSSGPQRELLGDTLADAVASGGGTGLALDLYHSMRPEAAR